MATKQELTQEAVSPSSQISATSREAQLSLDRLQGIYERALAMANPQDFFLTLYEYLDFLGNDPMAAPIALEIKATQKTDLEEIEQLEQQIIQESQKIEPKIRKYIQENHVTNERVIQELRDYELYKSGKLTKHGSGPAKTHYDFIAYILMLLVEDKTSDHIPFARQFGVMSDEGRIEEWTFAPGYQAWEKKRVYWDRFQLTKVWYSLEKIVTFYMTYRDGEGMYQTSIERGEELNALGIALYFGGMKKVMLEGKAPEGEDFQPEKFKPHLQRVHGFVRHELLKVTPSISKREWSFSSSVGVLLIQGKTIKFKPNKLRAQILKVLCENEAAKHKVWQWDELYEAVEDVVEAPSNAKNKVYEAVKGIIEQITKQSGGAITDFLLSDTRTVHINPLYL